MNSHVTIFFCWWYCIVSSYTEDKTLKSMRVDSKNIENRISEPIKTNNEIDKDEFEVSEENILKKKKEAHIRKSVI